MRRVTRSNLILTTLRPLVLWLKLLQFKLFYQFLLLHIGQSANLICQMRFYMVLLIQIFIWSSSLAFKTLHIQTMCVSSLSRCMVSNRPLGTGFTDSLPFCRTLVFKLQRLILLFLFFIKVLLNSMF